MAKTITLVYVFNIMIMECAHMLQIANGHILGVFSLTSISIPPEISQN